MNSKKNVVKTMVISWSSDDVKEVFERTRDPIEYKHYVAILDSIKVAGRELTHVAGINFESIDTLIDLYLNGHPNLCEAASPR